MMPMVDISDPQQGVDTMAQKKEKATILSVHVRASDSAAADYTTSAEEGTEVHNEQFAVNADSAGGHGGANGALFAAIPDAVKRALNSIHNRSNDEQVTELCIIISCRDFSP